MLEFPICGVTTPGECGKRSYHKCTMMRLGHPYRPARFTLAGATELHLCDCGREWDW